jgi:hypothetical protein
MEEIATLLSVARKVIITAFCPVLYVLHCPFNNAFIQKNGHGDLVSGTGRPADTKFKHPLKLR